MQYIAQPALTQNRIKFNTEITSIDITSAKHKPITLRSTTNEIFHADSLIVTLPLGTLKENTVKFNPPLPHAVQKAISNLGFGTLEKLFIRFSEAWWLTSLDKTDPRIGLEFYRFTSLLSTAQTSLPRGTLNFFPLPGSMIRALSSESTSPPIWQSTLSRCQNQISKKCCRHIISRICLITMLQIRRVRSWRWGVVRGRWIR